MSAHGHQHGAAAARAGARHLRPLLLSLGLIVAFLVVQVVVGIVTGSLTLLSDAGHMATDALGLAMAAAAIHAASTARAHPHRTFGLYRLEILAALLNAALLFAVAGYVAYEALSRLHDAPEIASAPVIVVGVIGLVVNCIAFLLLRDGAKESLNMRGAYLEVMSDMIGSVGVIVAAVVWGITGWVWVDPVVAVAIGLFILPRAWKLGGDALRVLIQAAPAGLDLATLEREMGAIDGVLDVHDLHVWTLTSEMDVVTAHLVVTAGTETHGVLDRARELLAEGYGINHATFQVEPDDHRGCDEMTW